MNEKTEVKSTIDIDVKKELFNDRGELVETMESHSKLTKADAGRVGYTDQDSLTVKLGCGCGKIAEVDYNGEKKGEAESSVLNLKVDIKGKKLDTTKNELIDAIAAGSKLTKADAGRLSNQKVEDWFHLGIKSEANADGNCGCPEVDTHFTTKTTDL